MKTDCPMPEEIIAYAAGEAEVDQAIECHLRTCPACREAASEARATCQMLRTNASMPESTPDLSAAILAKIPQGAWKPVAAQEKGNTFSFRLLLRLAATLLAVGGAVAGLWMSMRRPEGTMPGVAETQSTALKSTLLWLASVQDSSGRWDAAGWGGKKDFTLALNGLALLSFVRNPESVKDHAEVIERSARHLVSCQRENGLFGDEVEGMMYNHGIVTVALLEAYATGKQPHLKAPLDRALSFIRKQQTQAGGWGYANRAGDEANTSVAVWQLQALILGGKLGWDDQEQSLRKGIAWLSGMIDDGGQFGYERPRQSPEGAATLTAMGAMCIFTLSESELPGHKAMQRRLRQALVSTSGEETRTDYYRSYFRAAAFKAGKTGEYDRLLVQLQLSLLLAQEHSGGNAGSWTPGDKWSPVGGRIYSSAVAALTLAMDAKSTLN